MLCRFWTTNRGGSCLSDTCHSQNVPGTLQHLLIECPALEHTRHRMHSLWCLKTLPCPPLHRLILKILGSSPEIQARLILDSTACPELILLVQTYGQKIQDLVLYLTRTFAFSIHRQKLKLLGRWPESPSNQTNNNPRPSDTNDIDNPSNISLFPGRSCTEPSSLVSQVPPASSQDVSGVASPEVPGGPPDGDHRVHHPYAGHLATTQYLASSPGSTSMQELCQYARSVSPPVVNGEWGSHGVACDIVPVFPLSQPEHVFTVPGLSEGVSGQSSDWVGTGLISARRVTTSLHSERCNAGALQGSQYCDGCLGDRVCTSSAVVHSSQFSRRNFPL